MKKWNTAYYPFSSRDDGFRLWDALHRYVEGVLKIEYPSDKVEEDTNSLIGNLTSQTIGPDMTPTHPQDIEADEKLAGFHASLANPKEGNIPGFPQTPGNRQHISTFKQQVSASRL